MRFSGNSPCGPSMQSDHHLRSGSSAGPICPTRDARLTSDAVDGEVDIDDRRGGGRRRDPQARQHAAD